LPVPGNLQADLAEFGFDGLGREAVSAVVGGPGLLVVLFIAQMVGQLALAQRFDDLLADRPHEALKSSSDLTPLSLSSFFSSSRSSAKLNLLESFYSSKEVYAVGLHSPNRATDSGSNWCNSPNLLKTK
jgi:hypothetical protein